MKHSLILMPFLAVFMLSTHAQVTSRESNTVMHRQYSAASETALDAQVVTTQVAKAPAATPWYTFANSHFYRRPLGSYYRSKINYNTFLGTVIMMPPFIGGTLTNMAPDKTDTKWVSHDTGANDGRDVTIVDDEGKRIFGTYAKPDGDLHLYVGRSDGGAAFFVPALKQKSTNELFHIGYGADYTMVMGVDSFSLMSLMDTGDSYTGFTDVVWMGLYGKEGERTASRGGGARYPCKSHSLHQYYPRPLHPLCIEKIVFQFVTEHAEEEADLQPFSGTGYLDVYVVGATSADTLAHMIMGNEHVTERYYNAGTQQFLGRIEAFNMEEDMYFNQYVKPFVVDEDFYVVVSGFEKDDVHMGIMQSSLKNMPWDQYKYFSDGVSPTYQHYYFPETGDVYPPDDIYNINNGYTQSRAYGATEEDRQYNMFHFISGFFDVVTLHDSQCDTLTASASGQMVYVGNVDGKHITLVGPQWKSSCPYQYEGSRVPNYTFEGLPDWVTIESNYDNFWNGDNQWVNITSLRATTMPADISGRMATIYITSEFGARSEPIVLIQGDVTGIVDATTETNTGSANKALYNLAGQRVGNDYKGVVICNGKKYVKQ